MRVLVSPDCFTGTLSALEASEAIRAGWLQTHPNDEVSVLPVCDGGPGFLDVAVNAFAATRVPVIVRDPLGREIPAEFAIAGQRAWIESAQACGLHLLSPDERDAGVTSSFGVGQLIAAAIDAGATHITIGVGGTATNDAGAGMWAALGATAQGSSLDAGGLALRSVTEVDLAPALARIAGVEIVVVTDVDNPLLGGRGATATYATQKGATEELVMRLEVSLRDFAQLVGKRGDGKDAAVALGAGSGGGLGYGLIHLGAVRESGIEYVMQAVGFDQHIAESDIIITGEGCLDDQSLHGKVVAGVAAAVSAVGKPCIVLAGEVRLGKRECASAGIDAAYSMKELFGADVAIGEPGQTLQAMASRVAKTWGRA
jgi:glycerate kinase